MKYFVMLALLGLFGTASAQEKEKLPVCDPSIGFANSFCPNCDGANDVFVPVFATQKPEAYQLTIYNRWGQQLFETSNPEQGWDGQISKAEQAPAGTYFWVLKYTFPGKQEETCSGSVTLLR